MTQAPLSSPCSFVMSTAHGFPVVCCVTLSKAHPAVELHQVDLEYLFLQGQHPAGARTPTATPSTGEKINTL